MIAVLASAPNIIDCYGPIELSVSLTLGNIFECETCGHDCKFALTFPVGCCFAWQVFDYDWGLQDDFMGSAVLDLTRLDLGRHTELTLPLKDPSKDPGQQEYMGEVSLAVSLWPRTPEDREQVGAPEHPEHPEHPC